MPKELYLYSPIYDFVAENLITKLEDNKTSDVVIRMNTPGGSVFSGWGIIAKMKEHTGKIHLKVDGSVASMGSFILAYATSAEALDVSRIMIHRANGYVETPEDQKFLDDINADLRKKFALKIDEAKLKELKGIGFDEIFDSTKRIDVWLSAKEAKQIGLIDKVVKLNPVEMSAFNNAFEIAAIHNEETENSEKNKKITPMNIEKLKAEHPEVYAAVIALGIAQEKDRVGAWLAFNAIDPVAVKKGITDGKNITQTEMAEFTVTALGAKTLGEIEGKSTKAVKTEEVESKEKTDKEKQIAEFEAALDAHFGIK